MLPAKMTEVALRVCHLMLVAKPRIKSQPLAVALSSLPTARSKSISQTFAVIPFQMLSMFQNWESMFVVITAQCILVGGVALFRSKLLDADQLCHVELLVQERKL